MTRPATPGAEWEWTPGTDRGSATAFDKFQREERVKEMYRGSKTDAADEEAGGDSPSAA